MAEMGTSAPVDVDAARAGEATFVTIGPSPLKVLGTTSIAIVAGTVLVAVGVVVFGFLAIPWLLAHAVGLIVCAAAVLAGFSGFAAVGALLWDRPRVEIGPDGFVTQGMAGRRPRRWGDVDGDFTVIRSGRRRVVAYRLTDAARSPGADARPNPSLAGNDEAIMVCDELAVGASGLADLLNRRKRGGGPAMEVGASPSHLHEPSGR